MNVFLFYSDVFLLKRVISSHNSCAYLLLFYYSMLYRKYPVIKFALTVFFSLNHDATAISIYLSYCYVNMFNLIFTY